MSIKFLFTLLCLAPVSAFASDISQNLFRVDESRYVNQGPKCEVAGVSTQIVPIGHYYDWGRAQNGWGYCYEWASNGTVLNGGEPQSNWNCEQVNPSHFAWGRAQNGWGYCYQWTPYGVAMHEGSPQSHWNCEQVAPSHYTWGRGQDGNTYCYQVSPEGYYLHEGSPQSNSYCY